MVGTKADHYREGAGEGGSVPDLLNAHERALRGFGERVAAIGPDQWNAKTPCTDWSVQDLVIHLVTEQRWVPPLLAGESPDEDVIDPAMIAEELATDAIGVWQRDAEAAHAAFAAPGALQRTVRLSYGDSDAASYCQEMISDLVVHTWDLARGIGADERLDPELVDLVYEITAPRAGQLAESGLFDPPVPVSDDTDSQTRLLALFGRRA